MKFKLYLVLTAVIVTAIALAALGGFINERELTANPGYTPDNLYQADIKLAEKLDPYNRFAVPGLHKQVKKISGGLKSKETAGKNQAIGIADSPGRKVVLYPDRRLRLVSLPVSEVNDEIRQLIEHMKSTVRGLNGLGLSAPQVGVNLRVIVLYLDGNFIELINPEIITARGSKYYKEGCFSLPWVTGEVRRYTEIKVKGIDSSGRPAEYYLTGTGACTAQHEIDHLNGILFIDRTDSLEKMEQ